MKGYRFTVRGERFTRNPRGSFFIWRVVGIWNKLSEGVVETDMITFKINVYMYMDRISLKGSVELVQVGH